MKFISLLGASAALLISTQASAENMFNLPGEFDSYVTLTSEYRFRGISQSDENPAIQGGLDWSHDSGIYLGVWGSSIDFNDGDESSLELDIFGGYSAEIAPNTSIDVGAIYYAYPGADSNLDYDFFELYAGIDYDFDVAKAGISYNYSPEYFGDSGDSHYTTLSLDVPLPNDFTAVGQVGYQAIDDNGAFGVPDYTDWKLGVQYQWKDLAFDLSYFDTDLSNSECADGCDSRVIFAVSASF